MILAQSTTIFVDAYRELNAKKLFWISLGLNLLGVFIFASLGINERGFQVLFWTLDGQFNSTLMSTSTFYKFQFTTWAAPYWLTWGTTVLALISTAGIIPDLISSGTIEPVLSKPISRTRLFLTKYLTGLLFVFGQIAVFTVGCFLVLGIRGGSWEIGLFLAIPIVLAFYSYLFSVCAFVGLLTRSTIAALLLTFLFWALVLIVSLGEEITLSRSIIHEIRAEDAPMQVERQEEFARARIEQLLEQGQSVPGIDGEPLPDGVPDSLQAVNPKLGDARSKVQLAERSHKTWSTWSSRISLVKFILPKSQETISLLERNLIRDNELDGFLNMLNNLGDESNADPAVRDQRYAERREAIANSRTNMWILGTSFGFELTLLLASCWIFSRRDF